MDMKFNRAKASCSAPSAQECSCAGPDVDPMLCSSEKAAEEKDKAWAKCAEDLRQHDQELATEWKEQIDNLLVFAGIFSAVLTAFNVELYTQLNPDTTP
ncbi:hypothetical protein OBBRIDRAFT_796529 [Obba rivulosa]|uniref:DUF6535 domain-containing protein n=1 Tax=Obba rivulosa TaxID=1052685 RepID=A0A8E2ARM5_9APHY|nr:hypothetical protein OBBRIDRAFT_796529 [Obba rivulosa]